MIRFLALGFAVLGAALSLARGADAPTPKRVALVIDDGPIPAHNAALLALLAREHVHVTFSLVGQNVVAHPDLAKAIAAAGHEINNHSYTHPHLNTLSDAAIEKEIADTSKAIKDATGKAPAWFWSPFLEHDARVDAAVRRAGLEHFPLGKFHFIGSKDWEATTTAEQYRANSTTGIVDGTVILMHEWPEVTLANLDWVITELRKQGVVFVTFSELAKESKR
ncbi:MAG TPA: polysaccharide deacetylase family protein [Candidatus Didemnitutus sp.]|nr:polysaccharide deacetylase family protein [Candidatus Didemnitutus sp.]